MLSSRRVLGDELFLLLLLLLEEECNASDRVDVPSSAQLRFGVCKRDFPSGCSRRENREDRERERRGDS